MSRVVSIVVIWSDDYVKHLNKRTDRQPHSRIEFPPSREKHRKRTETYFVHQIVLNVVILARMIFTGGFDREEGDVSQTSVVKREINVPVKKQKTTWEPFLGDLLFSGLEIGINR